jgi:hypothetical protein
VSLRDTERSPMGLESSFSKVNIQNLLTVM